MKDIDKELKQSNKNNIMVLEKSHEQLEGKVRESKYVVKMDKNDEEIVVKLNEIVLTESDIVIDFE